MVVIKSIGLSNFRVFDKMTKFDFAPLTLLTGANNSGKSSLIKALLLLADNAKRNGLTELDFSGDTHHLDNFQYVKNRNSQDDTISFSIELDKCQVKEFLDWDFIQNYVIHLTYKQKGETGELIKYSIWQEDVRLFEICKDPTSKHTLYINIRYLAQKYFHTTEDISLFVDNASFAILEDKQDQILLDSILENYICNFEVSAVDYAQRLADLVGFTNRKSFTEADLADICSLFFRENFFFWDIDNLNKPLSYILPASNKDKFALLWDKPINEIARDGFFKKKRNFSNSIENFIRTGLKNIFSDFFLGYIECFKANSQRLYSNQSQGTSFNELLLKAAKTQFRPPIQAFIVRWLKAFEIGDDFRLERVKGVATEVKIIREGVELDLVDLGFGYTQIFPLILQIALYAQEKSKGNVKGKLLNQIEKNRYAVEEDGKIKIRNLSNDYDEVNEDSAAYKNKSFRMNDIFDYFTILVEEPEANLHPKFQSQLADLFLDASDSFGFQFIVETHSEYLIRSLQIAVAEGSKNIKESQEVMKLLPEIKSRLLAQQSVSASLFMYYFYEPKHIPEGCNQVEKISILPDGRLDKEFGEGFLDEATNLQVQLLKLKNRIN